MAWALEGFEVGKLKVAKRSRLSPVPRKNGGRLRKTTREKSTCRESIGMSPLFTAAHPRFVRWRR